MKISTRGEYALRALLVLGQQPINVVTTEELSQRTLIPLRYLEQILLQLKAHGFIKSRRGVYGGYSLRISPSQIKIGDVIRKLEGPLAPMGCVSLTAYEPCTLEGVCMLKPLWALIRDIIADVLDQTTLEQLLEGTLSASLQRTKNT